MRFELPFRGGVVGRFFVKKEARQFHIRRLGDFDVAVAALYHADFDLFQALHQAGFIGAGKTVFAGQLEGFFQETETKNLGRLREHQVLPGQRGTDFILMYALHGVDRNDADDGCAGNGRFGDDLFDQRRFDEGADGVVHGNEFGIGGECCQRILHRLLTAIATGDEAHGFDGVFLEDQTAGPVEILGAQSDDNFRNGVALQELADGVNEDRRAVQQHELLAADAGFLPAHARAEAGGREDDGDFHKRSLILAYITQTEVCATVRRRYRWRGRRRVRGRGCDPSHALRGCVRQSGRRSFFRRWFAARW